MTKFRIFGQQLPVKTNIQAIVRLTQPHNGGREHDWSVARLVIEGYLGHYSVLPLDFLVFMKLLLNIVKTLQKGLSRNASLATALKMVGFFWLRPSRTLHTCFFGTYSCADSRSLKAYKAIANRAKDYQA